MGVGSGRLSQVTEQLLGFAEMSTIRIGNLMDQPRMVRMQSLQNERAKQKVHGDSQNRKREEEERRAAQLARVQALSRPPIRSGRALPRAPTARGGR